MKHFGIALLLILTGVCIASNIYALIPIYQEVAEGIGISIEQAVYGGSVFSLCYAFGLLSFGPISEKVGRKLVLIVGLLFSSLTTAMTGFAFNETSLYVFRGIQGFTLASFAPVAFAYTFEYFPEKSRTLVLALINSGFLVAGIVGQLISNLLTLKLGWQSVFFGFSFIYFILFMIGARVLPSTSIPSGGKKAVLNSSLLSILKNPQLLLCYCITFTLLLSFVAYYDGLGYYFTKVIVIEPDVLFFIRAFGLVGAILSIFTGSIITRIGEKKTLLSGIFLTIFSLVLLLNDRNPTMASLSSVLFVAAISLLLPAMISIIGKLGESQRAIAISLYSFTLLTGASLGPIIAAKLPFSGILVLLISLFLLNILFCYWIFHTFLQDTRK